MTRFALPGAAALALLASTALSLGEIRTIVDHNPTEEATKEFRFNKIPLPAQADAASQAKITVVDGEGDRNGGGVEKLTDGKVPTEEDQPSENFFFRAGTDGGRLLLDLGKVIEVRKVNTYSWHPGSRGPQVYSLYGSDASAADFNPQPKRGTEPGKCGWKLLANVDTRPKDGDEAGGQYGVSIAATPGTLGNYRYLLFDISPTEKEDGFGNTFYSEIDVIDREGIEVMAPPVARSQAGREILQADGFQITLDSSDTPDLTEWVHTKVAPMAREWYPRIVKMLASEGYQAPKKVTIRFSERMRGVAATGGARITCAARWFRENLQGEAVGAVFHEMVHVVQNYGLARRTNPNATRAPGWLVEGIADYLRWYRYEPQTHGAEIRKENVSRAKYDANYRISANFLNWVTESCDKEIVPKLNAALRQGKYEEELWKQYTGHTVQELGAEWKGALEK